jgi:Fe-S-cluster containining protein
MFFQRFFWVRVFGQVVDIVLAREDSGACVFLDAIKGLCRVYPYRPLVCRTYICAQASRSAKLLRSALVNGGEDAAVRLWYARTEAKGLVIHEWEDFDPEALMIPQKSVWDTKKRYEDILIREVLPEKLWKRLEGKL